MKKLLLIGLLIHLVCFRICSQNLGSLYIKWAGVIDNAEGDDCPHGPTGKLYVLIYPANAYCPGDQKFYKGYINKLTLRGGTSGKFCKGAPAAENEWLDGESRVVNVRLYNWRYDNEEIVVFVYESDPSEFKGHYVPGRSHDALFCYKISRNSTLSLLTLGDSRHPAKKDAISNCKRAGITWYRDIWQGGLFQGIPSIFMQFVTE